MIELTQEELEFLVALLKTAEFSGSVEKLQQALALHAQILRKLEEAHHGHAQEKHPVQV